VAPVALPTHIRYHAGMTLLPIKPPAWSGKPDNFVTFHAGPYNKKDDLFAYLSPFRKSLSPLRIKGREYYSLASLIGSIRSQTYLPIDKQKQWLTAPAGHWWQSEWRTVAPIAFNYAARCFAPAGPLAEILYNARDRTLLYTNGHLAGAEMPDDGYTFIGYNLLGLAYTRLKNVDMRWHHFSWKELRFVTHPPSSLDIPPELQGYLT
jgi:hypothetical protein